MSKHWDTHTHTHRHTLMCLFSLCGLLTVVQTIFNTFTIIVNVCKISSIMRLCVCVCKRGSQSDKERVCSVRVCACVCAKWTFDFTGCCFLPVFCNQTSELEWETGARTPLSAAVLGILYAVGGWEMEIESLAWLETGAWSPDSQPKLSCSLSLVCGAVECRRHIWCLPVGLLLFSICR